MLRELSEVVRDQHQLELGEEVGGRDGELLFDDFERHTRLGLRQPLHLGGLRAGRGDAAETEERNSPHQEDHETVPGAEHTQPVEQPSDESPLEDDAHALEEGAGISLVGCVVFGIALVEGGDSSIRVR